MPTLWTLNNIKSPLLKAVLYLIKQSDDGAVNRTLANMFEQTVKANATPVDGVATFDAVVDAALGVWARVFVPTQDAGNEEPGSKSGDAMPVVLYFHGGGFVLLRPDVAVYDDYCRRLADHAHVVVVSVHYRRAPEHKYPAAYEDSLAALEWLGSAAARSVLPPGIDLSRTFLCGDSAGGNIVHHLAVRAAEKDLGPDVRLAGLVMIQPFFGGEERTRAEIRLKSPAILTVEQADWYWKAYLPRDADRDHPASRVVGPRAKDLRSVAMPPALVIIGGLDILQDWDMRYAEDMKKAGKDVQVCFYEDGIHWFAYVNQTNVTEKMMVDVTAFLHNHRG